MAYVLQSYQSYAGKGIRIDNRQGDELMQSIRRKLEPGSLPRRSPCW